eukprot:2791249-Rhodomonas_salina.1
MELQGASRCNREVHLEADHDDDHHHHHHYHHHHHHHHHHQPFCMALCKSVMAVRIERNASLWTAASESYVGLSWLCTSPLSIFHGNRSRRHQARRGGRSLRARGCGCTHIGIGGGKGFNISFAASYASKYCDRINLNPTGRTALATFYESPPGTGAPVLDQDQICMALRPVAAKHKGGCTGILLPSGTNTPPNTHTHPVLEDARSQYCGSSAWY